MNATANHAGSGGAAAVAELQGLYGPFTFPEKLLQKIWWRGDFDRNRARTVDGQRVVVTHPGRWNHLGGPDFCGARLRLGEGPEFTGDVEVHLHAGEWDAHGHARDQAYDNVALHVVLFPPAEDHATRGAHGRTIPALALLPLLGHDLEEYAADDAVESLAGRPLAQIAEVLTPLPPAELRALLRRHAEARWQQKLHFAQRRVQRLGWDAACHHAALEILGYRFNRTPMLRIAAVLPLRAWNEIDPRQVFAEESWSLHGVRPANHPRSRLDQYARWVRLRPDWPDRLRALTEHLPVIARDATTAAARRTHRLAERRAEWSGTICADTVRGTRFDNLMCDGFLPFLAQQGAAAAHELWQHWFAGDLPHRLLGALRRLEVFDGRTCPACHGVAQGLLGWLLEHEQAAAPPP
ncbi:MAG TPA: DUF2851 family protein [Opitutus sp.]|nr:DUF2851 family protein [Opitutus sp.]